MTINRVLLAIAIMISSIAVSAAAVIPASQTQTAGTQLQPAATDLNVQISEVTHVSAQPGGGVGNPLTAHHVLMKWTVSHPPFIRVLGFSTRVEVEFADGSKLTLTKAVDAAARGVDLTFGGSSQAPQRFKAAVETRFNALASTAIVTSTGQFILNKANNFDSHSGAPGDGHGGPNVKLTEVKNGPQGFTAHWIAAAVPGLEYTAFELEGDIAFNSQAGTTTRQATARAGGSARQATLILRGGGPILSGDGLQIVVNLTIKAFGNSSSVKLTEKSGDF